MISSVRDISLAYENGRVHSQRFFKNAGTTGDGQWHDWSYASGQPSYDARIGTALEFTPVFAQGNDAIYFPGIPSGMERRLAGIDLIFWPLASNATTVSFELYDLLGVYPLIDGDSTELQEMNNTASLPRYSEGIRAVLVNHVSPVVSATDMIVSYTNSSGVDRSVTWRATSYGQNKVNYTVSGNGSSGPLYCSMVDGDTSIARINSIQFTTSPGGLWAIYLVKPIARLKNLGANLGAIPAATSESIFAMDAGFHLPLVKDGASLGFFFMPASGFQTTLIYGQAHFIWG